MMDFTYEEMEGIFRKKRKRAISKLWEYRKEIPDPYLPQFHTKILFYIPTPTLFAPLPCILIAVANAKARMFFRVRDIRDMENVFQLPEDELQKASEALCNAQNQVDGMEGIVKDLFAGKMLPEALSALTKEELREIEIWLSEQKKK